MKEWNVLLETKERVGGSVVFQKGSLIDCIYDISFLFNTIIELICTNNSQTKGCKNGYEIVIKTDPFNYLQAFK